jgi:PAS domain S-box-containing protein
METKSKTKQQLLLELKEQHARLDAMERCLQEADERLQAQIAECQRTEETYEKIQKYNESIVETVREPLIVLAPDLRVIKANRSFYETFHATPEETDGRFIYSIGEHAWDIPALRKLLEEIVPQNIQFNDFEVDHEFPVIGRRTMVLNARRVYRESKHTDMILLAIEDITEQKKSKEALKDSETRYRRLFETAQDGILILDAETGQISDVNPFLIEMLGYLYEDFLGKRLWEIGAFRDIAIAKAAFGELQAKGYIRYEDLPLETKDGRAMAVEFVSNVYLVNHHKVIQCNIRDITVRKQLEAEREKFVAELQDALAKVKQLSGMLPICATCKKIRDDEGYWEDVVSYITKHSEALFNHGLCPECANKTMVELEKIKREWSLNQ